MQQLATDIQQYLETRTQAELNLRVSVRFGWSCYPADGTRQEQLVDTADQRMYGRTP